MRYPHAFFDIVTHKTVSEDCFVLTKCSELSRFIEISNTAESMSWSALWVLHLFSGHVKAKASYGVRRMPWLTEAMKDVISCDKPGLGANGP